LHLEGLLPGGAADGAQARHGGGDNGVAAHAQAQRLRQRVAVLVLVVVAGLGLFLRHVIVVRRIVR
jgi:hypothetical protein